MLKYLALSGMLLLSSCFLFTKSSKKTYKASKASAEASVDATEEFAEKKRAKSTAPIRRKGQIWYGMTRDEALAGITDRSELLVAEIDHRRGRLVTYQYKRIGKEASRKGVYYLYFMNDTLIRKSPPEDLETGAKTAVREYYRRGKSR